MNVEVNYLAVFLAAVSSMIVGSIWYARGVFGETWAKLAGIKLGDMKGSNVILVMGLTFVLSLLTAYMANSFVTAPGDGAGNVGTAQTTPDDILTRPNA